MTYVIKFLQPVADGILLMETDDAKLSYTVTIFVNRSRIIENNIRESPFSLDDISRIKKALKYFYFLILLLMKITFFFDTPFISN